MGSHFQVRTLTDSRTSVTERFATQHRLQISSGRASPDGREPDCAVTTNAQDFHPPRIGPSRVLLLAQQSCRRRGPNRRRGAARPTSPVVSGRDHAGRTIGARRNGCFAPRAAASLAHRVVVRVLSFRERAVRSLAAESSLLAHCAKLCRGAPPHRVAALLGQRGAPKERRRASGGSRLGCSSCPAS